MPDKDTLELIHRARPKNMNEIKELPTQIMNISIQLEDVRISLKVLN